MELISIPELSRQNFHLFDVSLNAGERPLGRYIEYNTTGRAENALVYVFSGEMSFFDKNGKPVLIATDGDLIYIPTGACYKLVYSAELTHFSLINFRLTSESGEEAILANGITAMLKNESNLEITSVFRTIENENTAIGTGVMLRRRELAYRLLSRLERRMSTKKSSTDPGRTKITRGAVMLEERYLENISIDEIADACYMSVSLFRKLFFDCYGMSPVKYRNKLRIDRAQMLLSEGDLSVAEVAELSGFKNPSYFCRLFKKMTGHSPTDNTN